MCVNILVSYTNNENSKFDTTPFREFDKKQIYPYFSCPWFSTVDKCFDLDAG